MKYFTRSQIEEIRRQLATLGIKDTDLEPAKPITGEEKVAIVQDGENRLADIMNFFDVESIREIVETIERGESAYDIAVRHGYTGSETEWLASLKGERGANGANGQAGAQGQRGYSAYQIAVSNGFSGTEQEWLASLKGDKGDPGDGSEYTLPVATTSSLGGVIVGSGLSITSGGVLSAAGGGGGGDDTTGGYWENAYQRVTGSTAPSKPTDGVPLDSESDWSHTIENPAPGVDSVVWMITRFVEADGTLNDWQGPIPISGMNGEAGADGDKLEFIYARTASETTPPPSLDSTSPDSGSLTPEDDDFVPQGWKDNASDPAVQIGETYRVMWMAYRIKRDGSGWSAFVGPFMWSCYGRAGADGDGLEYIFYAGTVLVGDPSTWTDYTGVDADFQDPEYIRTGSGWMDDAVDLEAAVDPVSGDLIYGPGTKQWVSTRRRYADDEENPFNDGQPYWHQYSEPKLWSYYPKDGDAGTGIVADFDNDMLAVSLKSTGMNYAFDATTSIFIYDGIETKTTIIDEVVVKDASNPPVDYTSSNWVSAAGNDVTISLPADAINLEQNQLQVTVTAHYVAPDPDDSSSTVNVTRKAVLTIIGINMGADGSSFGLYTSHKVIRNDNGTKAPSSVAIGVVWVSGSDNIRRYDVTELRTLETAAGLPNNSLSVKRAIDNNTYNTLSTNSVSTSSVSNYLGVRLYYNNNIIDSETIYVISNGQDADPSSVRFKSIVFKRNDTKPDTPGTGVNPSNQNYGGTFTDPIPYGWSDSVPAANNYAGLINPAVNRLWMTTRVFHGGSGAQTTTWSEPTEATDVRGLFDIEFALEQTGGAEPPIPDSTNKHDGTGTQVWFDPVNDKAVLNSRTDWAWKAERYFTNGAWEDWIVTRIKGENGINGTNGTNGTDGRSVTGITTVYGVGTESQMPASNKWHSDIGQIGTLVPGDWVWAKMTVNYSSGTSDVFYTKTRYASDGLPGDPGISPSCPYCGTYEANNTYYGNSARTDIVYYPTTNKYYRARPDAGTFSGEAPGGDNNEFWMEFGANYDNIATGFLFAEGATIGPFQVNAGGYLEAEYSRDLGGNLSQTQDLYLDARGFEVESHITASGQAVVLPHNDANFFVGLGENPRAAGSGTSRDGFVEITFEKVGTLSTGAAGSALYIDSDGANAITANGDVAINGALKASKEFTVFWTSATHTLGWDDAGTTFIISGNITPGTITLPSVVSGSTYNGSHFDFVLACTSTSPYTLTVGSSNRITTVSGGSVSSNLSSTSLNNGHVYRAVFYNGVYYVYAVS